LAIELPSTFAEDICRIDPCGKGVSSLSAVHDTELFNAGASHYGNINGRAAAMARLQEAQGRRQERLTMALTRDFRQTVRARAARDPAFRKALFQEAVQTLLQGDTDAGRGRCATTSTRRSASKN
jgi:hypothetical protein